jgi:hypothetical protein
MSFNTERQCCVINPRLAAELENLQRYLDWKQKFLIATECLPLQNIWNFLQRFTQTIDNVENVYVAIAAININTQCM